MEGGLTQQPAPCPEGLVLRGVVMGPVNVLSWEGTWSGVCFRKVIANDVQR